MGEGGNLKTKAVAEIFIPGSYSAQHEFIKNYKNQPLIALVRDANQSAAAPIWYQMGDDAVYCWIESYEGDSGTSAGGVKGYKLMLAYGCETLMQYTGVITYKP